MPIACKICIAAYGLHGSQVPSLPKTDEEFAEHIATKHHLDRVASCDCRECQLIRQYESIIFKGGGTDPKNYSIITELAKDDPYACYLQNM